MEHNNKPVHEGFDMVKLPDGRIINVRAERSLFPHTEGLSNLVSSPANEEQGIE
jgi:hypothetical protein